MVNQLKSYENYKETGLLWVPQVPFHWELTRTKNVMKLRKEVVGNDFDRYTLLSLTLKGIISRDMKNPKGKFPKDFSTYQTVNANDLVFCLFDIDETPRTVGLSPLHGMITGAYTIFNVVNNANAMYLYYYYLSLDQHKSLKPLYTGLRKVISTDTFSRTKIPLPPRPEQDQIVRFLDYKLAKINKFINTKKKLISILKEQKQGIINDAVTKGINREAEMKQSGIALLGEIPSNWDVKPLKHFVKSNTDTLSETFDKEKEINYIDISTVGFGELKRNPVKYKFKDAPSRARRIVHYGDTIISTVRTYLKSMCFVDDDISDCIVSTGFAVLSPNKLVYPKLLNYVLSSNYFVDLVSRNSIGVSYPAITESKLVSLKVALPTLIEEQREILDYITEHTTKINERLSIAEKEIKLISEYATRLILDVVTGKVDVRNIEVGHISEDEMVIEDIEVEELEELLEGEECEV
ncbi:restriction endonuclease subunit S [Bacillus altitudinis]|uniref:restriction endonuclease subunit S n=1 Tax=Bacillus altitudinis TaxID=293387 RepID=UPI002DBDF4F5|nr:restriction endonuclease subunit S [Bacillus altitudinis]MEC0969642.1 restriction endonuclease subunit S [Bacillus altitudinis]MEC1003216.1 restriction endonuclease subunit S [Bacillus altitudinis]